jgi:hypothetical protein
LDKIGYAHGYPVGYAWISIWISKWMSKWIRYLSVEVIQSIRICLDKSGCQDMLGYPNISSGSKFPDALLAG